MKFHALKKRRALIISVCLIYAAVPARADIYDMIYTVQSGCYEKMETARKLYVKLTDELDKTFLDFLRIEEVGRSYCVRLGKFKEEESAKKFHQQIKPLLGSSTLLKAYVLDERVRKMYFHPRKVDGPVTLSKHEPAGGERTVSGAGRDSAGSVHEKRGDRYVEEKRLLSAAEEYQLAIRDDPDNATLTWKLAELLYDLELVDDAFKFMQKAISLSPGEAKWRRKLGMLYYDHDRLGEAEEQFIALLALNPEAPDINYYLGRIYLARNMPDNARDQFIEALKLNPGSAASYYYLGKTYFQKNNRVMAWTAVLTAERLGYESEDFVNEMTKVSKRPEVPWDSDSKNLLIRQIVVQSRDRAEDIIFRLSQGENYESIANDKMGEPGETLEYRDPAELDAKIAGISQQLKIFAEPVIVETQSGFHVIQRIPSIIIYENE